VCRGPEEAPGPPSSWAVGIKNTHQQTNKWMRQFKKSVRKCKNGKVIKNNKQKNKIKECKKRKQSR
jgi:hypothetical protein